jgi:tetratricopeptide (TPR) repeat protein
MDSRTGRFERIEAIFHEALAVAEESRTELISARCEGDTGLAAEVELLLNASEMEQQQTAALLSERDTGQLIESAGRRIGPYVLDSLLGRGGMGAVYLAHRADGEFEQKVAIKLIDLPLVTATFRERFRQERQILAGLQHPYIARLLDGGVTGSGDPYLVMEFVDGVPIQQFCERENLSLRLRLKLFLEVCEAVQFAHQNFVVHRDLKPDNILVAADGTPRLLDFGTAKLLSPSYAAAGSGLTREGYQSFTPQYASPEQVLGKPVTAASDTYSLGVLLYLLLTGKQPYELAKLTTEELLRVICEEPPRKPAPAESLDWRLDADLNAILLKALRKEPSERYGTAIELGADIRAWLDGMPVAARRGTFRYKAAKFIHRNRIAVISSVLLAASMLAGVVGVAWQARVANEQRRKAEASAADLRQLSNSLLTELDEAIEQLPGTTGVQKLLITRVLEHLDRTAKDSRGNRQMQLDLADAYAKLGNIQGNTYSQNLGDFNGALASMDKAISLVEPLTAHGSKDGEALRAYAFAQAYRSEILFGTTRMPEAIASMQASIAVNERIIALPGVTPAQLCDAASVYGVLGDELGQGGDESLHDIPGALKALLKDVELANRALSIDPHLQRALRAVVIARLKIAETESETDPAQALKDFQFGLERVSALSKEEQGSMRVLRVRNSLLEGEAEVLVQLGRYSEAHALYAQAAEMVQHLSAADPLDLRALFDVQTGLSQQAIAFETAADPAFSVSSADRRSNLDSAEKLLAQEVTILQKLIKQDPSNEECAPVLANAQVHLGTARSILRPSAEAAAAARTGLASLKSLAAKDQASPTTLDMAAGDLLMVEPASLREPQTSLTFAGRAVALTHGKSPSMLLTLAQAYRATGQIEKSRATAKEGLALLVPPQPGSPKPHLRKLLEIQTQPGY